MKLKMAKSVYGGKGTICATFLNHNLNHKDHDLSKTKITRD